MKVFKIFFLTLIGLILTMALVLITVWFNLGLILNANNVEYFQDKYFSDLKMDWSKVEFKVENESLWNKKITLNSEDQCLKYLNSEICLDKINLQIKIYPLSKKKFIIQQMLLKDQKIRIALDDFSDDKKTDPAPIQQTIDLLKYYLVVLQESLPSEFSVVLDNTNLISEIQKSVINVEIDVNEKFWKAQITKDDLILNAIINLTPNIQELEKMDADLAFQTKDLGVNLSLNFISGSQSVDGLIDFDMKDPKLKFKNLKYKIEFFDERTEFSISQFKTNMSPYLDFVRIPNCKAIFQMSKKIEVACPKIMLGPSYSQLDKKLSKTSSVIKKTKYYNMIFQFGLTSTFREDVLIGNKIGEAGQIIAKLKPIKDEFLNAKAYLDLSIIKNEKSFVIRANKTDIGVSVFSFKKLVQILSESAFAIPAPFNKMDGNLVFNADDVEDRSDFTKIKFQSKIRLTRLPVSKKEVDKITVDINGNLDLSHSQNTAFKTSLETNVLIKEVMLHAPDFDPLRGLPKLTADSRILPFDLKKRKNKELKLDNKDEAKPSSFKYSIRVGTEKSDSIKIKYQHFKPYVPIAVDLLITDEGMKYKFNTTEKWAVEYLNRKVFIESIEIQRKNLNKDYTSLDMNLLYKATNYRIFINIIGSIENPVLKLSSEPSLSREDIISVLLYNRTSSDLTRFENESVGGAESAISDKAIGLIGMWAFASTPIESFSYDSKSQIYRAQIALPGGVKFDIGTDWERVQNLSLRKRLNDSWVFVTSFEPGTEERGGVGNVFLQREWVY